MPVSGLVITLANDRQRRDTALAALSQEPRIELGVLRASRLAIVVDTATPEDDQQLWQWLNALPGVEFVEVALVGFD